MQRKMRESGKGWQEDVSKLKKQEKLNLIKFMNAQTHVFEITLHMNMFSEGWGGGRNSNFLIHMTIYSE